MTRTVLINDFVGGLAKRVKALKAGGEKDNIRERARRSASQRRMNTDKKINFYRMFYVA